MSIIVRGARNAFRNLLRTVAISLILGISLGLSLVMITSRQAVDARIAEVKSSIGNLFTVTPAGVQGFEGGGDLLTDSQLTAVAGLPSVTGLTKTLNDRLQPTTDTSLASAIEPGNFGNRQQRFVGRGVGGTAIPGGTFSIPITVIGTDDPQKLGAVASNSVTLTSGSLIDADADTNTAMVGSSLATKNSLQAGSTFTAYGQTITVSGVFDAGNDFANGSVVMPLAALQRLSDQVGQVGEAIVQIDSIDHLATAVTAAQTQLGDAADVTSSQDTSAEALTPLLNIRKVATTSIYGSLVAGAVILLLTMMLIVRERRREIAVLKAIGSSNAATVGQFVTESTVFTLLGSAVGMILAVVFSNSIFQALVSNSEGVTQPDGPGQGFVRGAAGGFRTIIAGANPREALENLQTAVGFQTLLIGLAAAIAVAIVGSAIPAWLISKVRPAEVLRGDS